MELNGIANLQVLLGMLECHLPEDDEKIKEIIFQMRKETDCMHRYLAKVADHVDSNKLPYWHKVKADPAKFPKLAEKFKSVKEG